MSMDIPGFEDIIISKSGVHFRVKETHYETAEVTAQNLMKLGRFRTFSALSLRCVDRENGTWEEVK